MIAALLLLQAAGTIHWFPDVRPLPGEEPAMARVAEALAAADPAGQRGAAQPR